LSDIGNNGTQEAQKAQDVFLCLLCFLCSCSDSTAENSMTALRVPGCYLCASWSSSTDPTSCSCGHCRGQECYSTGWARILHSFRSSYGSRLCGSASTPLHCEQVSWGSRQDGRAF